MHFKTLLLTAFVLIPFGGICQTTFGWQLAHAADELTKVDVVYNGAYFSIDYPGGDVPSGYGVCTDVIIRAYRAVDIDLQKEVHEDMKKHFSAYPQNWGLTRTDSNIDHRRVPNLRRFFERHNSSIAVTSLESDYLPGDIVSWVLSNGLTHIGIVSSNKIKGTNRYYIVHNIGAGQVYEDCLFQFKITGHYRYEP
ncbi:DUF1287 domain-containing protein [Nonlabens sp. Asnod3-H03]|uniref:DUF1287 domain-containing protein n=1 Tax=Nonlabens sp. Asnod3-H03 TaxID=3160580 RepID=UPI0038638319